jgi:hypothetical protein
MITYPRQQGKTTKYEFMAVFDTKKMEFTTDKAKLVEVNCDEGIGHAPIVDHQECFFLGSGHMNIIDLINP